MRVATSSLRDHLLSQLAVLNLPLRDRRLVGALIDALDDDGYLHLSLEEVAEMFPEELEIDPDELSIALCYLQSFEPAGIGARDASECLALQLKALPETTPFRAEALTVVTEHLPLLAARDFVKLKRLLHTDDAGVCAMRGYSSLTSRPTMSRMISAIGVSASAPVPTHSPSRSTVKRSHTRRHSSRKWLM